MITREELNKKIQELEKTVEALKSHLLDYRMNEERRVKRIVKEVIEEEEKRRANLSAIKQRENKRKADLLRKRAIPFKEYSNYKKFIKG